jgi:hypothetical protein
VSLLVVGVLVSNWELIEAIVLHRGDDRLDHYRAPGTPG